MSNKVNAEHNAHSSSLPFAHPVIEFQAAGFASMHSPEFVDGGYAIELSGWPSSEVYQLPMRGDTYSLTSLFTFSLSDRDKDGFAFAMARNGLVHNLSGFGNGHFGLPPVKSRNFGWVPCCSIQCLQESHLTELRTPCSHPFSWFPFYS